jgi:hypothetical protein
MPASNPHSRPRRRLLAGAALAIALVPCLPGRLFAQVAVIVNPSSAVEDLSADALKRLFLGQATTLPGTAQVRLATHTASAERFDRVALGLEHEVVRSRWMAMTFRGEATAIPSDYAKADDVKRFVRAHPEAIAYLPLAEVDASVKVLRIDGRRPGDAGYLLR